MVESSLVDQLLGIMCSAADSDHITGLVKQYAGAK